MTTSDTVVSDPGAEKPAAGAAGRRATGSRARPPGMRGSPYLSLGLVLVGIALFRQFGPFGRRRGNADLYNTWLFYSVLVVGFYFVFGVSGQFAFSQAAIAAVGGYTSAWATRDELFGTDSFWVGLVVGVVVTALIATAFSFLMRRASEFYLAIGTLGLSSIVLEILAQWTDFTNSSGDSTTGINGIRIFGLQISGTELKVTKLAPKGFPSPVAPDAVQYRIFWVWFVAFGLVMLLAIWLARSPVQREAIAGRDQAAVAATLGVPVFRLRVTMFVLGSAIARCGGVDLRALEELRDARLVRHQPRPRHLRDAHPRRHRLALGPDRRARSSTCSSRSGSRAASSGSRARLHVDVFGQDHTPATSATSSSGRCS